MQQKLLMQAEHIALSFGEQKVLDIDRFAVYQGERIGLVGANGAGKTTLAIRPVSNWLPNLKLSVQPPIAFQPAPVSLPVHSRQPALTVPEK